MVKDTRALRTAQSIVPSGPSRPPAATLAHLEGRFFVVIRPPVATGVKPGIYSPPCPPIVIAKPSDHQFKFPIVVVCATQEQANDVNKLNDGIADVGRKKTPTTRITAFRDLVDDSVLLGGTARRWYGVWLVESSKGSIYRTIFAEYRDYKFIVDAAQVADGRQHRRFEDIRNAVTWFLAEGNSSLLCNNPKWTQYLPSADRRREFDTPDTEVRNIDPTIIALSDDEDDGPEEGFLPSFGSPSVNTSRRDQHTRVADSSQEVTTFKGTPQRGWVRSPSEGLTPYELSRFATPTPSAPNVDRRVAAVDNRIPANCYTPAPSVRSPSAGPQFGSSVSRQPSVAPTASVVREASSSLSTFNNRSTGLRSATSALPSTMDNYLRAHGYDTEDILRIETAWIACLGNEEGFVQALDNLGVSHGATRYLWSIRST